MQRGKAKAERCWKTLRSCGPGIAAIFAEGKHGASSPCSVWGSRALTPDGCLVLAVLCAPGRAGSVETDCRPTRRKKLLNWLKDREMETAKRASSSPGLVFPVGVALGVVAQMPLECRWLCKGNCVLGSQESALLADAVPAPQREQLNDFRGLLLSLPPPLPAGGRETFTVLCSLGNWPIVAFPSSPVPGAGFGVHTGPGSSPSPGLRGVLCSLKILPACMHNPLNSCDLLQ